MIDIVTAILAINPSAEVSVNAEDFEQITWHNGTAVISKADIQAKQAELQAEYDASKSQPIETQPQPPEGGSVPQANVTDKAQVADVSISTEDIIRQAMADAGM